MTLTQDRLTDDRLAEDGGEWIKAPDVAEMLGVSVSAVRSWVARRKGPPHYRIMGNVRFKRSEVETWIEEHRVET